MNWIEIEGSGCTITIEKRPSYCNRGRVYAKLCKHDPMKVYVSEADPWPRYYFFIEHAAVECVAWLRAHGAIEGHGSPRAGLWTMVGNEPVMIMEVSVGALSMNMFRIPYLDKEDYDPILDGEDSYPGPGEEDPEDLTSG